jgi:putative membrane protein
VTDEIGTSQADVADATRRTRLANERTYLAWWRTGLTSFAVSLGVGRIVPDLTSGERWPYAVVGVGYAALGLVLLAYGFVRERAVDQALDEGRFSPVDVRFVGALTGFGVPLGLLTLVLVLVAP